MVQNLVSTGVLNLMKDSFSLIALVYLMFYQNWKLAIFALFMMPLAIIFAKSLGKRIGKVQNEAGEIAGNLTSFLSEIFKSSKMIRIYQKEEVEYRKAQSVINKLVEKNIKIARKSIVAKVGILKGEIFSSKNLAVKRPSTGISPMHWHKIIGKKAIKDYKSDDFITI